MEEMIALPEIMFHPSRMRKRHFYDEILSTLTTEPIQEIDSSLTDAVSVSKINVAIAFKTYKLSFLCKKLI